MTHEPVVSKIKRNKQGRRGGHGQQQKAAGRAHGCRPRVHLGLLPGHSGTPASTVCAPQIPAAAGGRRPASLSSTSDGWAGDRCPPLPSTRPCAHMCHLVGCERKHGRLRWGARGVSSPWSPTRDRCGRARSNSLFRASSRP